MKIRVGALSYEDYLEIQKLWLKKEVHRWEKAKDYDCAVMDFGAEEIEFYTLNYPKTIGADFLNVDHFSAEEVGQKVKEWVDYWMKRDL